MTTLIDNYSSDFDSAIAHLKDELGSLRIGRANPSLVENVMVEAYGAKTPLQQVASITVPQTRTLLIQPWDKSISKDIEKAIIDAQLGLSPVNEGGQIRLNIPQLTEDSRKDLVRTIGDKSEKTRIQLRQVRDRIKDEIQKQEKNNELTEDDKFDLLKKLDERVKQYTVKVKELSDAKEQELMTI